MSSVIQPRTGEDVFQVGRFILDRAKDLGLTRTDLVRRLRYQNLGKGHNALAELLKTGNVPPVATRNLADALEVAPATVDADAVRSLRCSDCDLSPANASRFE